MVDRYEPQGFEAKWRQRWKDADLFRTREDEGRPKFYGLDFFPYPSGAGLSVGHCRNYVPTDVLCRLRHMQGYNVLHPMGFDAFGLPAENEAIKTKSHPRPMIDRYAETYRRQMDLVGISYDWSRSFKSCDEDYYRWTQWIFGLLYRKGLAYRKDAEVNWCPKDKTALANEEVVGGLCERCGTPVERKAIPQWYFRITAYAQRLIDDLDDLDWPEGIKAMQRNWIGRSEGVQFRMSVHFEPKPRPDSASTGAGAAANPEDELEALRQEALAEQRAEEDVVALAKAASLLTDIGMVNADLTFEAENLRRANAMFDSAKEKVVRSGGLDLDDFEVVRSDSLGFEVFTTRIDTVFGVTFCVLAPEHPLLETIKGRVAADRKTAIEEYQGRAKSESEATRLDEGREKSGVFTGAYAEHPVTGESIPVWTADYVLMGYGTGAIMAVPAGDQRDFEFAVKFGIPVRAIQDPTPQWFASQGRNDTQAALQEYRNDPKGFDGAFVSKDEPLIGAGACTGLKFEAATEKLGAWMESRGIGERKVQYRLRDWLISRQRYWGCPIPVCYDQDSDPMLIPENQLPVELPDVVSYEPSDDGSSPLSRIPDFVNCTTPEGRLGRRETDTMGGFACSSWYFLRFCDPHNDERAWDPKKVAYWMPVDTYVGGAEHAVMHLLYARFWTKVLFDEGLVPVKEPFQRLKNQGQVLGRTPYRKPREGESLDVGEDGILMSYAEADSTPEDQITWKWVRMSKSKGNVVTPDEAVEKYGADALRLFELFVAPFDADVEWSNDGMTGTSRFLSRVFKFVADVRPDFVSDWRARLRSAEDQGVSRDVRRSTHKAVRKATEEIERFSFNTYVSTLMEHLNTLNDLRRASSGSDVEQAAFSEAAETLVLLLAPGAPHSADEMWEALGRPGYTFAADWPKFDQALAKDDLITIAVQVNGKLRDTVEVSVDTAQADVEAAAQASAKVAPHLEGKTVRKVVYVPGKLVNIVAS